MLINEKNIRLVIRKTLLEDLHRKHKLLKEKKDYNKFVQDPNYKDGTSKFVIIPGPLKKEKEFIKLSKKIRAHLNGTNFGSGNPNFKTAASNLSNDAKVDKIISDMAAKKFKKYGEYIKGQSGEISTNLRRYVEEYVDQIEIKLADGRKDKDNIIKISEQEAITAMDKEAEKRSKTSQEKKKSPETEKKATTGKENKTDKKGEKGKPEQAKKKELDSALKARLEGIINKTAKNLKKGEKSTQVGKLQEFLSSLGIKTSVDDDFGSGTKKSVRLLQKQIGEDDDGVIGPKTAAAILKINPGEIKISDKKGSKEPAPRKKTKQRKKKKVDNVNNDVKKILKEKYEGKIFGPASYKIHYADSKGHYNTNKKMTVYFVPESISKEQNLDYENYKYTYQPNTVPTAHYTKFKGKEEKYYCVGSDGQLYALVRNGRIYASKEFVKLPEGITASK